MTEVGVTDLSSTSLLIIYGPLGLGWIIAGVIIRALRADNKEKDATIANLQKQCADERKEKDAEIATMNERYVTKFDTVIEKYHGVATSISTVLDSALRKRPP